jgi:hypothetical protein
MRLTTYPAQVKEPWKAGSEGIEMYTPMNRMVRDEWKLTDEKNIGFQLDFADVRTCTAKGYPTKGCMMAADIKMILPSLKSDHKAIMGVKVNGEHVCTSIVSCPMVVP